MCGIAGKVVLGAVGQRTNAETIRQMTDVLCHRGPDAGGVWVNDGAAVGNRRLAVIDLDPRSHQPMSDDQAGVHVVFNGEIYNYRELRRQLQQDGVRLRTESDTEVILRLYLREGQRLLAKLRGMFAFAVWDERERRLLLARDRIGKKPLYYRHAGSTLWFGSEPKAIFQDPDVPCEVDLDALDQYLSFGYVPAPGSAFAGFQRLPPGHLAVFDADGLRIE
jgi:asparagine synthase (glutamine-hydrolysing)